MDRTAARPALFFARRYNEAIKQLKKARQIDQNDIDEQTGYLFMSYERKDEFDNALEWFLVYESQKGVDDPEIDSFRQIYARSGWPGVLKRRLEIAEEKERNGAQNYNDIASLAAQVGDKEKAFAYLEKALPIGELFKASLRMDPNLDLLRSDPRFDTLIAAYLARVDDPHFADDHQATISAALTYKRHCRRALHRVRM